MKTVFHNNHRIEVATFFPEKVFYDGRQMTSKNNVVGESTHVFCVEEEGKSVTYEIEIKMGWWASWIRVRRNGIIFYSDK